MSIRALVDNKFIRRFLIIGLGGFAFMAWGAYDAFVAGPFRMEMSQAFEKIKEDKDYDCLLYTSPSPRDKRQSRMPSSA